MAQARREKAAREQRDITQADVAKATGVSKGSMSRYESDVDVPRDAPLERIATYLGVSKAYLRYGVTDSATAGGEAGRQPSLVVPVAPTPYVGRDAFEVLRDREEAKAADPPAKKKQNGTKRGGRGRA